jgi:deaminated glutathione amidase
MSTAQLRLAVVPMTSTDRVEVNTAFILSSLEALKAQKPDLICFPENSLYFNFQKKLDPTRAVHLQDPFWSQLSAWARAQNCFLHLGGIPLVEPEHGIVNASVLIDATGEVKLVYRKIHLFDVNVEGREVRESDSFCAGTHDAIIDIKGWRVGMSICYDLRFAELFIRYHKQLADLILVPSSFLVLTGRSHWQTLLRARAIETQCYIAAPAQVGTHRSQLDASFAEKQTWGESLVIGPWGEIIAASSSFDQAPSHQPLFCVLDKQQIQKTRAQIPLLSHRRLSL